MGFIFSDGSHPTPSIRPFERDGSVRSWSYHRLDFTQAAVGAGHRKPAFAGNSLEQIWSWKHRQIVHCSGDSWYVWCVRVHWPSPSEGMMCARHCQCNPQLWCAGLCGARNARNSLCPVPRVRSASATSALPGGRAPYARLENDNHCRENWGSVAVAWVCDVRGTLHVFAHAT